MFFVQKSHSAPAVALLASILLLSACTLDKTYDLKPSDIDMSVTVFEDGLTVPLGSSEKISLGSLINSAGEGVNDFIATGSNGELILSYNGSTSLNDQLAELDLANMAVIDGVSFSEPFTYHIGDFDASNFTIAGETHDLTVKFDGMDVINVSPASISGAADGLSFHAGLDEYKDVITGNADLDLAKTIGNIIYEQKIIEKATIANEVANAPENTEINVPANVVPPVVLPEKNVHMHVDPIKLDDNVTGLTNIKTSPNAKLNVTITLANVCFTAGTVTPDVDLDFNGLLHIKGGDKINLKSMKLTSANGWSATQAFDVQGLYKTDYQNSFTLDDDIPVSGTVTVEGAKATKAKVNGTNGDIELSIDVHFSDFTVYSADLAIIADPFQKNDSISLGDFEETTLPDGITDVKGIVMDETKPLKIKIVPKNVNKLKSCSLPYNFTLTFPNTVKVKNANNGQIVMQGDLANGPAEQEVILSEIYPTINNGKISMNADVNVVASVQPQNIVIDSSNLPQSPDEDLSFTVEVEGTPTIKDYVITLDNYEENIDLAGDLEVDAGGLGDIGGVRITPEGNPVLTISFDIPDLKGLSLKPGKNGVKISLPSFLVFDGSAIAAEYGFNASENSITLRNSFPNQIAMPIKELNVQPTLVDGKYKILGSYSAKGGISIPGAEVSQSDLKESFGSDIGLSVIIPEIKAASIALEDNLSFDIDQKFNMTVKNIPEQLKRIDEILLDEVYVNLDAEFDGLPSSAASPFTVDLTVTLPEFIAPNVIPVKGTITGGKLSATPVKLEKLYGIDMTDKDELKGELSIVGSISAAGASIDLANLKSDITATITASIQNANGKIAVSKATGVFSYDIDQETELNLDSIPEMLKGDDVSLEFEDPRLDLDISTNLGIPMSATLELIPFINGVEVSANKVTLSNVQLPYSTNPANTDKKSFSICKEAASAPGGRQFIKGDISKLLKKIPDSIKIKINAGVDPNRVAVLQPSATYTLDIAYGISVPLSFGEGFKFATSTELGLQGAADVIAMGDFSIEGDVVNTSPLNLSADLYLMDANGGIVRQNVDGQAKDCSTIDIKSPLKISLSVADKSKAKTVTKARLDIKVTAIPDVPVKETDCLQFTNLVAKAGGITVDPSKK